MAKKTNRVFVTFACQNLSESGEKCNHHNYVTEKNKVNDPDRLELKKFCPVCRLQTVHKETR